MKRTKFSDNVFNAYVESQLPIQVISRITGISRMTISRIIKDPDHCHVGTLIKILKCMGYRLEVNKIGSEKENMDDGNQG